jgi:hypothetical protein
MVRFHLNETRRVDWISVGREEWVNRAERCAWPHAARRYRSRFEVSDSRTSIVMGVTMLVLSVVIWRSGSALEDSEPGSETPGRVRNFAHFYGHSNKIGAMFLAGFAMVLVMVGVASLVRG